MPRRARLLTSLAALFVTASVIAVGPAAQATCDPFTSPAYAGNAPSPEDVLGFSLGSQEVTDHQIVTYLDAIDAGSTAVTTAKAATSVQGRAIKYAIVGKPSNVTPSALATLRADAEALRDPTLPQSQAGAIESSMPRILWLAGNVHGTEESGADAGLQILYDLADRTDCAAKAITDGSVVFIMPTQNPDGRALATRRNAYGFDMNRDWFARTQPETDGKVEVLRQYPPMLFMDEHEFGNPNYLFPPHADPEYAETPDQVHDWIFDTYGPAMENAFDRFSIRFHHGAPYDFFATEFGDTVPALGFHAAGMTFEQNDGTALTDRLYDHYTSAWASLSAAARLPNLVTDWHNSYVKAYQEGVKGQLEPNRVFQPKSTLYQQVPDITVRQYFLLPSSDRRLELHEMVRRLQRMDVSVYKLTAPLTLSDFHPYDGSGDAPAQRTTLPTGTYWIPLAQGQKNWIQSMLHDESWIATDLTYDVTAWSNPLLLNLRGGWSGAQIAPSAQSVPSLGAVPAPTLPANVPNIGLFEIPISSRGFEAAGQFRWLADTRWHLPYTEISADDIRSGRLDGIDELVIPDGYTNYGLQALGSTGKKALRTWVQNGGRLVAWQGGAEVAARAGISTATFNTSKTNMPGSIVRVALDPKSPLAKGVGRSVWVMYDDDDRMDEGIGTAPGRFPSGAQQVDGLDIGSSTLAGTTALADEQVGQGRVISFSIDPNFRGWTEGTWRLLWNALVGPDPSVARTTTMSAIERRTAVTAARRAAAALPRVGPSPLRIGVPVGETQRSLAILRTHGVRAFETRSGATTILLVPNLHERSSEKYDFGRTLDWLRDGGVSVRWAHFPE
jgi:hypothetical protein